MYNINLNLSINNQNLVDLYQIEHKKPHNLPIYVENSLIQFHNNLIKLPNQNAITNYIYISLGLFVETFTKYKITIFNRINWQTYDVMFLVFLNNFYINLVKLYKRNTKNLMLYNTLVLIFLSLFFKDLVLLKNFITLKFKHTTFKKHKKLLTIYRYIIKYISTYLMEKKIISGVKLIISGKIGMAGSSKKKKWMFKNGELKLSSKTTKLKYEVFHIWTKAGTLGVKLYLAYN